MATSFDVNAHDLTYILKQIQIAELQAGGMTTVAAIMQVYGVSASDAALLPAGLRTVDGHDNNLLPGHETAGAGQTEFPRLTDPRYVTDAQGNIDFDGPGGRPPLVNGNYTPTSTGLGMDVIDTAPRVISNLIVDQTAANPAAIYAALKAIGVTGVAANTAVADISQAYRNTLIANGASAAVTAAQAIVNTETVQRGAAFVADQAADAVVAHFVAGGPLAATALASAGAAETAADALAAELATPTGADALALHAAALAAAQTAALDAAAVVTALGGSVTPDALALSAGADALVSALDLLDGDGLIDGADSAAATAAAVAYAGATDTEAQGSIDAIAAGLTPAQTAATASQLALDTADAELSAAQAALATAVAAAGGSAGTPAQAAAALAAILAANGIETGPEGGLVIENLSPDIGLSPAFNSFMTIFGQFFDHGLDLVNKGGNGTVYVPLEADDPLIAGADHVFGTADDLAAELRFMTLTRATQTVHMNTDGTFTVGQTNATTAFVDQNQTYTSHASHQVFLREYVRLDVGGVVGAHSTGALLDATAAKGSLDGAIATWADVKAQALEMLGIRLEDGDVGRVPLLLTDAYGNLKLGAHGYAQMVMGDSTLKEGTAAGITTVGSVAAGPAFIVDIAHHAAPGQYDSDSDHRITPADAQKTADTDPGVTDDGLASTYDDEMLGSHVLSGDGRGNENIALTAMHTVFHSEHNRIMEANKATILATGDLAFINQWLLNDVTALPADTSTLVWDGDRMFQAARFSTEMQYQHMVFEEFGRRIQPAIDPFVFTNSADIDPSILAEFAHTVYRFGHSMLTDTVDRLDANLNPVNGDPGQITLIDAFLNPQEYVASGADLDEAQAAFIRGLTSDVGNEIDEFIVPAVRSNLLGLPLDLAALNIARGRETGVPSLNDTREQLYNDFALADLKPYVSWSDFAQHLKNPISLINFVAAYGNHATILAADTLEERRAAATLLVLGGTGAPGDRLAFLNGTGAYDAAHDRGGLDRVDLWVGGLAEQINEFGGMLGSTFNFIFEYQLEALQNGDRLYYLSRTQGLNMLNQLEGNTFTDIVMRNSALSDDYATHLNANLFVTADMIFELDHAIAQRDYNGADGGVDPEWDDPILQAFNPKVVRVDSGVTDANGHQVGGELHFQGGEHVVLGGTEGNDTLTSDKGIDALWGDGGDDYLNAGMESDQVFGGDGNDIIEDPFGDNFLRGERGDDVISSSRGLNILFGGEGKDVLILGQDAGEVFAGEGDDFILGGSGADAVMGNEGSDWMEGGDGFDGLTGENSELFFNSTIVGHDVLWGQGNDTDYDLETGDDIAFSGAGIQRFDGMFGFDWAIAKFDQAGANFDFNIPLFTNDVASTLRDRFDLMEGMSGWNKADILQGDNRGSTSIGLDPELTFDDHVLTAAGIARIDGLAAWMGGARATLFGAGETTYRDGNIMMGGAGSDMLRGRGGFDLIDGDSWLNVRIRIVVNGHEYSAESLNSAQSVAGALSGRVFNVDADGRPDFTSLAFGGRSLTAMLLDRTIKASQMSIVREVITDAPSPASIDTAAFFGNLADYVIEGRGQRIDLNGDGDFSDAGERIIQSAYDVNGDGFISVADQGGVGRNNLFDDTDLIRNIERLDFADGTVAIDTPLGIVIDLGFDPTLFSGTIPGVGTTLGRITSEGVGGVFSLGAGSSAALAVGPTGALSVTTGLGTNATHLLNLAFTAFGLTSTETVTLRTGSAAANTITGNAGDDIVYANGGNDTLSGLGGSDVLFGQDGLDSLVGGDGGDVLIGGTNTDAVFGGAGDDRIIYTFGDGTDAVDGGAGTDILEVRGTAANQALSVGWNGAAVTSLTGTSSLVGIEEIHVDLLGASDTLIYTTGSAGVIVNLTTGTASGLASIARVSNVTGGNAADQLTGDGQANTMFGSGGADTFGATVDDLRDIYVGGAGVDVADYSAYATGLSVNLAVATAIVAGSGSSAASSDTVNGVESLIGGAGADRFAGSTAANRLRGGGGADTLSGNGNNDILFGDDGDDVLDGGIGQDQLTGGLGEDSFVFALTAQSTTAAPDRIFDFEGAGVAGGDHIDIGGAAGDDFVFIGSAGFAAGASNQVRFFQIGANTFVDLDTDGDTGAEARIQLDGTQNLSAADFIL